MSSGLPVQAQGCRYEKALVIDPENCHAIYQLACAYTALELFDDAVQYLSLALAKRESYRDETLQDPAFEVLREFDSFRQLISQQS